jgi:hypothetical protein
VTGYDPRSFGKGFFNWALFDQLPGPRTLFLRGLYICNAAALSPPSF